MEHSSLDLSIVKKEPGFDEPFSSEHGIFDNMMSDDFHDTSFHSVVSADSIHTPCSKTTQITVSIEISFVCFY